MKKRLGLFLGILLSLTFIFSVFGNGEIAKAADVHYDDVLVGSKNLNNTASNSAKIGDALLSPEIGWKRYDDSNSKIQYLGDSGYWKHDITTTYSDKYYKNTRSFYRSRNDGIVRFTVTSQRIRIIGNTSDVPVSIYSDNIKIGELSYRISNSVITRNSLVFEYDFGTVARHDIEIRVTGGSKVENSTYDSMLSLDAIDIDSTGEIYNSGTINNPVVNVESPKLNNTYTGNFNLSGYALNKSGVKAVKVYIDGVYSRDAQIGIQRTDIGAIYTGYPGAGNSGFSTTYNVSNFAAGVHTIKIQVLGNDGTVSEQTYYLYAYGTYVIMQSANQLQKITDIGQLKVGDIVSVRCMGATEGNRWLDGRTADATVGLAPYTGGMYSGTKWQVYSVNGYYALKCLGTYEGKGWRWLDGNTATNVVALAPNTGEVYSGTQWGIIPNGDGTYGFQCMGTTPGNRWLDGNTATNVVSLAPYTGGMYSGTKWEIYKAN